MGCFTYWARFSFTCKCGHVLVVSCAFFLACRWCKRAQENEPRWGFSLDKNDTMQVQSSGQSTDWTQSLSICLSLVLLSKQNRRRQNQILDPRKRVDFDSYRFVCSAILLNLSHLRDVVAIIGGFSDFFWEVTRLEHKFWKTVFFNKYVIEKKVILLINK